jgi:hypothetical protein
MEIYISICIVFFAFALLFLLALQKIENYIIKRNHGNIKLINNIKRYKNKLNKKKD